MPYLNAFLGDKGGIGKSFVCLVFVQYLLDRKHPFQLFDSDRTNPNVARIHHDICSLAIFSEGSQFQEAANGIYNAAAYQDVALNCPAQVSPALNAWLDNNDILAFAEEDGISLRYWFVTDGGLDSLKILRRSLERYGNQICHIVVKNWGVNDDNWQLYDNDADLQQLLTALKVTAIDFPLFHSTADCQKIDTLSLTFGEARTYKDFSLITRNRVRSFLRKAYAEFDAVLSST